MTKTRDDALREAAVRFRFRTVDEIAKARERHEEFMALWGIPADLHEEIWELSLAVDAIQYPPGPTPEEEQKMMRLGGLVKDFVLK